MTEKLREYQGEGIIVSYDVKRCIHAERCVHGLPGVFNPQARPWIQPQHASADAVAAVVAQCPTGALHFRRTDGGAEEATPAENVVRVVADGPLYMHGDVTLTDGDGVPVLRETRAALCRCGVSEHKPYCDNSHIKMRFQDSGRRAPDASTAPEPAAQPEPLTITPRQHGPLVLKGQFELLDAAGQVIFRGNDTALCRCGGSGNKPFCDGTHKKIGFRSE